jgi:hypothetical protein
MLVHVLDDVLRDLELEIVAYPPERGGALLGPVGRPFVTRFVADVEARTTAVSYRPSRWLDRRVRAIEIADDLELKGIVHSHPLSLDRPSSQDEHELEVGLGVNPHLAWYLAPIITHREADGAQRHEVALLGGKASFYAASRVRWQGVRLVRLQVEEVPMRRDLERVRAVFGGGAPELFHADFAGVRLPAGRVRLDGGLELLLLASELYPAVPPIVLVTGEDGETEQLQLAWQLELPAERRLEEALRAVIVPPGPYRRAWGPAGGPALTRDPERARQAGWSPRFTGADPEHAARDLERGLFARSSGLLSRALRQKRVLVAGLGSVGSYAAEQLVRSGVGALALVDPETVEPPNLSRTAYESDDVGRRKVDALARRLLRLNPRVDLRLVAGRVDALAPEELAALVQESDLVLAATDDPTAQLALNRVAHAKGIPALFVGLYAGAQGGEVVISVPERTPCFLCATRARHSLGGGPGAGGAPAANPDVDYGTGRLVGEVALGVDIQHVTSAAVKLALSLLLPAGSAAKLARFAPSAIREGLTYLTMSMVPRYWFYPSLLGEVPGQHAYQSVWLTPERSPDCPVCGDADARVEAADAPLAGPDLAALRAVGAPPEPPSVRDDAAPADAPCADAASAPLPAGAALP